MSRPKRNKLSADGVDEDGRRVINALDAAVMREAIATAVVKGIEQRIPTPPPRTDSWFVEQESKKTPPEASSPTRARHTSTSYAGGPFGKPTRPGCRGGRHTSRPATH